MLAPKSLPTRPAQESESSDDAPRRVIGKRQPRWGGGPPSLEARQAMAQMARYQTRAPKGLFFYRSHEEANADRDRWQIDAVVAKATQKRHG